ncbi:MAG: hypothetical protein PHU37_11045 [Methanoculleus chikugoensis]|nr:hypothetical protein [Methanoculleus chikugoensis]
MSLMETIRGLMGWCPAAEGQAHRQMQPGPEMRGDTPHDGRRRIGGINMEIDFIVKEELWRSTAVFWILVIITAFIITADYLPIPAFLLFPLPLAITAVIFCIVVWYRRKECLTDPNPVSILHHALGLRNREKKTKRRGTAIEKVFDAILLAIIFLIYLYASLAYSISQIYWLPVLIVIGLFLARIVFTDGGVQHVTVARSVIFYLIVAMIFLLRYLALGYPIVPLLQAFVLIGIVSFPILYIWERRRTPEGTD